MEHITSADGFSQQKTHLPIEILTAANRGWKLFPLKAGTKDGQLL